MAFKASVIIAAYNCASLLKINLKALAEQTAAQESFETIIVDDGSTDSTKEVVQGFSLKNLKYIQLAHSGRSRARNAGLAAASGEIIIFLDSDAIPDTHFVDMHVKAHMENQMIICRGIAVNTDNPLKRPGITISSRFVQASFPTYNCSVRREHLDKSGYFDQDFTEYGWEDLELGHRLLALGLKKTLCRAVCYHCSPPLTPANVDASLCKEEERGRMAVLYCSKSPTAGTRISTMNHRTFMLVERFLNMGGWADSSAAVRLAVWFYSKRLFSLFNLITGFRLLSAYFRGLREASDARSERIGGT